MTRDEAVKILADRKFVPGRSSTADMIIRDPVGRLQIKEALRVIRAHDRAEAKAKGLIERARKADEERARRAAPEPKTASKKTSTDKGA